MNKGEAMSDTRQALEEAFEAIHPALALAQACLKARENGDG